MMLNVTRIFLSGAINTCMPVGCDNYQATANPVSTSLIKTYTDTLLPIITIIIKCNVSDFYNGIIKIET